MHRLLVIFQRCSFALLPKRRKPSSVKKKEGAWLSGPKAAKAREGIQRDAIRRADQSSG
jgi:hypothetical protein